MMKCTRLRYFLIAIVVHSIPIDNGLTGDPEIICGDQFIQVIFQARKPFDGHAFVKGHYRNPDCRRGSAKTDQVEAEVGFMKCGMRRERSANPRGVYLSVTFVVSFHRFFVTKVDRAFRLRCFYMEAEKPVDTEVEVSMIPTLFKTETIPMPVCRYDLLQGGPDGPKVRFAVIGQAIYHKWTCDTESIGIFCMSVHSCYVDDTNGNQVLVINENGCSTDRNLIGNPEYLSDLSSGQESHVFKFADRPYLYFNCQIRIDVKEPMHKCQREMCAEPPATRERKRRQTELDYSVESVAVDVSTEPINVYDKSDFDEIGEGFPPTHNSSRSLKQLLLAEESTGENYNSQLCISNTGIAVLVVLSIVVFLATSTVIIFWLANKQL